MIGKIEKARRYAQEKERIRFQSFVVNFRGDHDSHIVAYEEGKWECSCRFFALRGVCSHTMTMERVLTEMLERSKAAQGTP